MGKCLYKQSSGPTQNSLQSTNNKLIQKSARRPHTSRGFAKQRNKYSLIKQYNQHLTQKKYTKEDKVINYTNISTTALQLDKMI